MAICIQQNHCRFPKNDSGQNLEYVLKEIWELLSIDSSSMDLDCKNLAHYLYSNGYIKEIELTSMLKVLYF